MKLKAEFIELHSKLINKQALIPVSIILEFATFLICFVFVMLL